MSRLDKVYLVVPGTLCALAYVQVALSRLPMSLQADEVMQLAGSHPAWRFRMGWQNFLAPVLHKDIPTFIYNYIVFLYAFILLYYYMTVLLYHYAIKSLYR